jgi:hypothetical protein
MADMTDITNIEASQRILAHLHEGRLVQRAWHREWDGRELACILGAVASDIDDTSKCPSAVMPQWLSRLVVPMFDGQSKAHALSWAARFGAQMGRWHVLDSAAWERVSAAFCSVCVADARRSADSAADADADAAEAAWAALVTIADSAQDAAEAASTAAAWAVADIDVAFAASQSCWSRMATTLCDLIDAELEAVK